jgi:peptide/nickel transport system permease protein
MFYLIRRLIAAIPLLIVLSVLTFTLIQLPPGDYADLLKNQAMGQGGVPEVQAQAIADAYRLRHGLNDCR